MFERRHHSRKSGVLSSSMRSGWVAALLCLAFAACVTAQVSDNSSAPGGPAPPSVAEKWNHFETETFAPFTLGAAAFNASVSQATKSTPEYGSALWPAYPERFGSAIGDIISQNFFGDFLLASAFHEDTRYFRRGPEHRLLSRIGYAISRSVITRTDAGEATFNWSNVAGTAMSAGLSNAYYPDRSRTAEAAAMNWVTDVAGSGFANLLPEFWPDFHEWLRRRLHRDR